MSNLDLGRESLSLTGLGLALSQRLARVQGQASLHPVLREILEDVAQHFEIDAAAIVMRKSEKPICASFLQDLQTIGISPEERKKLDPFLEKAIVPEVLHRRRCVNSEDARQAILGDLAMGQRTRMVSMLAVPMIHGAEVIGMLLVFRAEIAAFCVDDEILFQKIASLLGEDIESAGAYLRFAKDSVTGFYNRRVFFDAVNLEAARARRYQAPLSALVLDIETSHLTEQFLKRFAQRITSEVRQSDIIAKASDSSFLFLLPMTNAQSSFEFAQRICRHLQENPISLQENFVPINIFAGISNYRPSDDDAGTMFMRADRAVNEAKRKGENQIIIHPESND